MHVLAGTSGFSYKEWKGSFYPEDLPADEMLRYYAVRLSAVEINNTFYRMPKADVLSRWAEQVPDGFRFVLKASQQITHRKRLKDAAEAVAYFFQVAVTLGDRMGPIFRRISRKTFPASPISWRFCPLPPAAPSSSATSPGSPTTSSPRSEPAALPFAWRKTRSWLHRS